MIDESNFDSSIDNSVVKYRVPLVREVDVNKSRTVRAESHALVLKIAFTSLIADGAVERMIDQKKLHDTFSRLPRHIGIGLNPPPFHNRHCTGCHWL